jgi:hypothetical protein
MRVFWLLKERIALDARFDQVEIGDPQFLQFLGGVVGVAVRHRIKLRVGPEPRTNAFGAPHGDDGRRDLQQMTGAVFDGLAGS